MTAKSESEDTDPAALASNWDSDQADLRQINTDLYNLFGANPNAPAADYMAALRAAITAGQPRLYRVTIRVMNRIADDVDGILADVHAPKWTQAAHFVSSFTAFTTFAFEQ